MTRLTLYLNFKGCEKMILVDVRIKNYKCILDSETFAVDQLTCLVGKNESGKSAILQALYKLNPVDKEDTYDALYEYPKMYQTDFEAGLIDDGDTVVISHWKFTPEEIEALGEKFGVDFINESTIVTVSNGYNNKRTWDFDANFHVLFEKKMEDFEFGASDKAQITSYDSVGEVRAQLKSISALSEAEQEFNKWFDTSFPDDKLDAFSEKNLLPYLPKFSYFSEYQKLPGRIALNNFVKKSSEGKLTANEKVFEALLSLASTSITEIKESNKLEALINKTRGISSKITREIFAYWSQNKHLKVEFRCDMAKPGDEPPFNDGYIFSTRIENTRHDSSVSFDDRSAGFVWFFSFLIWFNYIQKEENNLIILLDEPGLTLHAKAQGDLIRYFKERIVPKFQLVYTTHSPFMLDFSDILSARTVEDVTDENENVLGTKVGSKVLSKDRDTTFPLQAAFGYDITQTLFIGKNTLLVEGPSDILYLTYFSEKLQELGRNGLSKEWTICPSGGIDKIQSFVSLFGGNALKIVTLTDYHPGDKNKIDRLKKSGLLETSHILLASDYTQYPSSDIEDIIGASAYAKLVNACYGLTGNEAVTVELLKGGEVLHSTEAVLSQNPNVRFDHYRPSMYLIKHSDVWTMEDIAEALDRFEKVCTDINKAL